MPNKEEEEALTKIKAYLAAGHELDVIRRAGWESWVDHLHAKGYDLATGQLALRPPDQAPAPDPDPAAAEEPQATVEVGSTSARDDSDVREVAPKAGQCSSCGNDLPFLKKLMGRSVCAKCDRVVNEAKVEAEAEYERALSDLLAADASTAIQRRLPAIADRAGLKGSRLHGLHLQAFRSYLETALDDDCLTETEESALFELGKALNVDVEHEVGDMKPRLLIAKVNDGRLPTVSEPCIMLKKDEAGHAEMQVSLLKEVKVREYQGGYSGFSFRIAKGVRYHTGGTRGRSVVVGTQIEVQDEGVLSLTSQRAVYTGSRKTIEMPYKKLVNLSVYSNAVQFHMSNRQNPPMFQVEDGYGDVVAAIVNIASQPFLV